MKEKLFAAVILVLFIVLFHHFSVLYHPVTKQVNDAANDINALVSTDLSLLTSQKYVRGKGVIEISATSDSFRGSADPSYYEEFARNFDESVLLARIPNSLKYNGIPIHSIEELISALGSNNLKMPNGELLYYDKGQGQILKTTSNDYGDMDFSDGLHISFTSTKIGYIDFSEDAFRF
jgi:hypothetical protein